jgi:hypothetical protein
VNKKSLKKLHKNIKSHFSFKRVLRLIRNIYIDLKFGAFLGGGLNSRYNHLGANGTSNTDYSALNFIFKDRISTDDVLVDVGCGKGRVLNWWLLNFPFNKIYGIEIDPIIAKKVQDRLQKYKNVHIICGSAIHNLPPEGNIFYLFNPFNGQMISDFKDQICKLGPFNKNGKKIQIFWYTNISPIEFISDNRFTVKQIQIPRRFHQLYLIEVS